MIKPKTPIANKPISEEQSGDKFFIVNKNIIPLKPIDPQSIIQIQDFRDDIILSEPQIKSSIRENKSTNRFAVFFNKVKVYLNHLESFLKGFRRLQLVSLTQKRINLETEKTEQNLKTYKAKKIVKNIKKNKKSEVNLQNDSEFAGILALSLGLGVSEAVQSFNQPTQIYSDVVGEGEFAVDRSGEQTQRTPAWIPFPKGTQGLTFTSGFGYQSWRGYEHGGIDIGGAVGTPIITPISGIVSVAGWNAGGYGNWVIVKSGSTEMIFGHMYQTPPVRAGQQIQAGTVVGGIGSTGRSTGPHLHWTIQIDGRKVDPALWTQNNRPGTATAGARSDANRRSNEPSSHPSMGDFDGRVRNNESEGGINIGRKIMVGEADTEFVIPMSKMPLFIQGMLEEKIKSLNPFYQCSEGFQTDMQVSSGSAKTKFASGGIAGGSPEFWQIVAISAREDMRHPQGQADVAQSIYNRAVVGSYPGGKSVKGIITAEGQYEPTFHNPGAWSSITDRKTAIAAAGKGPSLIDMAARSITNPLLQRESARFIGGRTDFMGESQKPHMKPGDITRGSNHNFFGWFYDARLPKAAPVRPSVKSMTKATNDPPKPKVKDKNIFEKFMLWINPPRSERASLNQIDGSMQMKIASDYRKTFDMQSSQNTIILYKPTVEYPELV